MFYLNVPLDNEHESEPERREDAKRTPGGLCLRLLLLGLVLSVATSATVLFSYVLADKSDDVATGTDHRAARHRPIPPQLAALREKYGKKLYSQNDEETFIRDFFKDRRDGFFVDIGASHYKKNSTTYYLEEKLGWQGIAVDALEKFRRGYEEHRPRTRFFSYFVSDHSDDARDFYVVRSNDRLSSGRLDVVDNLGHDTIPIRTITLDDLLASVGVTSFDFLSMDIERAEPAALAGFDIDRYRPELVCIEAHKQVRDQILEYFRDHDYVELREYSQLDPLNLYFSPAKHRQASPP